MNCCKGKRNASDVESKRIVSNLRWVIFPEDKWVRHWDGLIIFLTVILFFVVPFQIGVSFGYYLFQSTAWLAANVVLSSCFFIDNIIYFFRAYRNKNGVLIVNLKKIRRHYLRTYCIPNFLSTVPTTLIFYLCRTYNLEKWKENESVVAILVWVLPILKFLRFIRLPALLRSSQFVKDFRSTHNSQNIALLGYLLLLILASHLFACTWSFVAMIQASTTKPLQSLISTPNWISFWYNNNYEEGSLNPANPDSFLDRYILSLFWAVQTITSIGYGNVLPFTRAEYFVSSALMLLSGIIWAYIIGKICRILTHFVTLRVLFPYCFYEIQLFVLLHVITFYAGGLVGVAAGLGREGEIYGNRLDQASELIKDFYSEDEDQSDNIYKSLKVECSRRIRSYIHIQKSRSQNHASVSTMFETYPVIASLTPDLQLKSCLIVMRGHLNVVPYLSSKYLTMEEQSEVAMQCAFIEFAAGERVIPRKSVGNMGPGVLVMVSGMAIHCSNSISKKSRVVTGSMAFGENAVLLEDKLFSPMEDELKFFTFSRVAFIPRRAILNALLTSENAWKKCGRWRYLMAIMISLKRSQLHTHKKTT